MESQTPSLEDLAIKLATARKTESDAKAERLLIEDAIVASLKLGDKQTLTVDAGNGLKLTAKTDLSYKAEVAEIEKIDSDLIKSTIEKELNVKVYEVLRKRVDPEGKALFDRISALVTVSPKRPTVTLKVA